IQWTDLRAQGSNGLAGRAAKKLRGEEALLVEMGGIRLRTELDRIPLWTGNHVSIKQLCEYTARYLYLPRLRDDQVLVAAILDGVSSLVWKETFAYAEGWDEQRQRYLGLRAGSNIRVIVDDRSLLVKPEAAAAQIEADQAAATTGPAGVTTGGLSTTSTGGVTAADPPGSTAVSQPGTTVAARPRRFHGSVVVDPMRLGRDASRIAEEVVQHLTGMVGSNVEITIEIQADLADGASDKLVRDVTENCRTLRFTDYGFEES
ncbi:MAG: AAA+ family ATPase, partial [Thermomicrobiales bacterium]